mmetsp:Transcript_30535/g.53694  ORF Transcript_30535/g.53694 Transcript_30535/m.53694 type:complete len:105 (-) Transcript_30535:44-358(-)
MANSQIDISETLSTQFYRSLLDLQDGLAECRDYANDHDKLDTLKRKQLMVLLAKVKAADKILSSSLDCIQRMKTEAPKLDVEGIKHISRVMKRANVMVKASKSD